MASKSSLQIIKNDINVKNSETTKSLCQLKPSNVLSLANSEANIDFVDASDTDGDSNGIMNSNSASINLTNPLRTTPC